MFNRVNCNILAFPTIDFRALLPKASITDWFGREPIAGHGTSDKPVFDSIFKGNKHVLKQTSRARNGRFNMFYQTEDFMIVGADEGTY